MELLIAILPDSGGDIRRLKCAARADVTLSPSSEHHISMATETLHLTVRGMTCANCVRSVERKLSFTPGVLGATVDLEGGRATVEYESSRVKPEALAEAIRQLGYEVPA